MYSKVLYINILTKIAQLWIQIINLKRTFGENLLLKQHFIYNLVTKKTYMHQAKHGSLFTSKLHMRFKNQARAFSFSPFGNNMHQQFQMTSYFINLG